MFRGNSMKRTLKLLALTAAGVLLSNSFEYHVPFVRPDLPDPDTLRAFAEKIGQTEEPAAPFCTLRYSENEQQLYRDGQAVGQTYADCRVRNGSLVIAADGAHPLTPQEAAEQIGCEVTEENGDITVSFPFQTARLIVKSAEEPELHGGRLLAGGYRDLYVIQYGSQREAYLAFQAYQQDPDICYADCDRILAAAEVQSFRTDAQSAVCGTAEIGADAFCERLRNEKTELPEIRVAVIDSGIYAEHAWLKGRVLSEGANLCSGISADASDDNGHGTHCAGIIASGTPENVMLLPVKVLDRSGYGSLLSIYCGLMYALEQNANVINFSLGGYGESPLLDEAVDVIAEADIPLCNAAGNDQKNVRYVYPAYSEKVITVSAVDRAHHLAEFSNYGSTVDFAAPGMEIVSSVIGSPTAVAGDSGTSMATPFVTAAVADLLSFDPDMTTRQIYDNLRSNAVDLGEPGFDEQYGWGEISLRDFHFVSAFCRPPVIQPSGGNYRGALSVTLTPAPGADEQTKIYYTTDGSDPDPETASCYTGSPILLEKSAKLKAVAVNGDAQSRTASADYCIDREEVAEPFVIRDDVLLAYQGIMSEPDLSVLNGEVTAIGADAFAQCTGLRSVTLPDSITEIGAHAFSGCSKLTDISGKHVSAVGEGAFSGCTALRSASFQPLAEIGASAFRDCEALRTLENGCSEALTVIPANAFRGCAGLTDLSMPSVTQIGDYAFSDCKKLSLKSSDVWEKAEIIGAHAFEHAGLTGTIRLTSLRSLGSYAFADNAIGEILFSDALTALPEGVCKENPKLRKLTAAGVTSLAPYALQQTDAVPVALNMDLSRITSLGCAALDGVRFSEPVVFSGLRTVEEGALDGIQGPGFRFPAVLSLDAGAVHHAENAVLYFENLVTIRSDAVKQVRALVVGDQLKTAEPGAVSAEILAGPAGSVLEQYAEQAHANFKATPCILTNQKTRNVRTGETVQLQALPLGFGNLHVRWTDEAGNTLPDDSNGILQTDIDSAGNRTYRAVLYQGDTETASADFHVHASNAAASVTELRTDELYITDLKRAIADGTAVSSGGYNYHITYRFRAEADSTYRLLLTGACNYMNIQDADGEPVPYERDTGTTEQNAVFIAEKGRTYLIDLTVQYSPYQGNSPVFALRLTDRELSELTPLTENGIQLERSEEARYIWQGEPVIPEETVLRQRSTDTELTENSDYLVYCTDNTAVGTAICWIFGIGDYCGSVNYSYQIYGILREGKPLETGSALYGQFFEFTPEEDGDYRIFPDYSDAWIAEQQANKCFDVQYWHNNDTISVHSTDPTVTNPLKDPDLIPKTFTDYCTYPLKKGITYQIVFTRNPAAFQPQLSICPERGIRRIEDYIFDFEGEPEYVQLGSEPFEGHIICKPVYENDPELTEGKDYTVTYISNDRAGEMAAIIRGIGNLRGTTFVECHLIGQMKQSACAEVHLINEYANVEYQFVPDTSGPYVFYTDCPAEMSAEAEKTGSYDPESFAAEPQTELTLMTGDHVRLKYNAQCNPGQFTAIECELTAGESYIIGAGSSVISDFAMYAEKADHSIGDAEVSYQKTVGRDEVSTNTVTVTYGDTVLKAGTDYTVTLLDGGNGQYLYWLKGIGSYCGSLYCPLTVTGKAQIQQLEPGVPFVQKQASADYILNLTDTAVLRLRPADQSEKPFYAVLIDDAGSDTERQFDSDMQNITLPAGSYTMTLEQESGTERSYVLDILETAFPLSESIAEVQNTVCTGQTVKPAVRLSFRDKRSGTTTELTEGVDYRIAEHDPWTEPGQYLIRLTGIGNWYGDKLVSFCILPSDPESLPLLTDGDYNAKITAPGSTVFYRWDPKQKSCIVSDGIRNRRFSFYTGTELTKEYSGPGYQFFIPDPVQETYCVVAVSFCNASESGEIGFCVKSDFKELSCCQTEIAQAVPYEPAGSIPAYTVKDGERVLQEGTDYEVLSVGGETHCGAARIVLRGTGRYVGECSLDYDIYPEKPDSIPAEDLTSEKELVLKEKTAFQFGMPGEAALYTFTAPEDGTYYLVKECSAADAVSVFVYLPDGSLMPVRRTELRLSADDCVRILLVNNWLNTKTAAEGTLCVTQSAPSYIWTDETSGITYFVKGDSATVTEIDTDAAGVMLPDTITDPDTGEIKTVAGIHADVLRDCAGQKTFYLTPGGEAEKNLASRYDLCFAYAYPESVKPGDVTGTGKVDLNDVLTLLRILSERKGMVLSSSTAEAADCNGDGILDLSDVRLIMQMTESPE